MAVHISLDVIAMHSKQYGLSFLCAATVKCSMLLQLACMKNANATENIPVQHRWRSFEPACHDIVVHFGYLLE
ncbi:hypothetical protein Tco_0323618 [Tanacetum coccineum]